MHDDIQWCTYDRGASSLSGLLLCGIVLIGGLWAISVLFPQLPGTSAEDQHYAASRRSLELIVASVFEGSEARVEQRAGGSVYIYVSRHAFENVPAPDRSKALFGITRLWCGTVHSRYVSRLVVRDMRTDEVLASQSCFSANVIAGWREGQLKRKAVTP